MNQLQELARNKGERSWRSFPAALKCVATSKRILAGLYRREYILKRNSFF